MVLELELLMGVKPQLDEKLTNAPYVLTDFINSSTYGQTESIE